MQIKQVQLNNFRNYHSLSLSFTSGVHIFWGSNAQGKTNLLEAIFIAVLGKSFRANHDDELIRWDATEGNICVNFANRIADYSLQFNFEREKNRENILNGKQVKKKEVIGILNAVFFSPEDLGLIKGNPSQRRRFIDFEISQTNSVYYHALIQYNRAIYQRNHLLKRINEGYEKRSTIDLWDQQLIDLAEKIVFERRSTIIQLTAIAAKIHNKMTNGTETLSARYFVFGAQEEDEYKKWYSEILRSSREKDIRRGTTEFGPHRDDIVFEINSFNGKTFASQGQQRTIVLSLKLAEIELMRQHSDEYPILLLDDVMSELDEKRRIKLIEEIDGKVQTFITGTEKLNMLDELNPVYYKVEAGSVY
ncbi:MAG: DNA replication/repair protein RecF [Negativicutes bacterium]